MNQPPLGSQDAPSSSDEEPQGSQEALSGVELEGESEKRDQDIAKARSNRINGHLLRTDAHLSRTQVTFYEKAIGSR